MALSHPVIPAKAGTQIINRLPLGSRFRGNDSNIGGYTSSEGKKGLFLFEKFKEHSGVETYPSPKINKGSKPLFILISPTRER
jgi:hypothetical protein